MTTAKICGLSTIETLDAAVAGGASHVGLVFFEPSPRHLSFERAEALASRVPRHVQRAGVFVDPDSDFIERAVRVANLHVIQLHKTAPRRVADLRNALRVEAWAAVAVKTRSDLERAADYLGAADRILYDAKTPDDAALP